MYIVGIDYSMTCPAITILSPYAEPAFDTCIVSYLSGKKPIHGRPNITPQRLAPFDTNEQRFHLISEWAISFIQKNTSGPVQVYIEDYAYGAKGRVFEIGENAGVLKHKLWHAGLSATPVPPTVVKKFASGKGNADKDMMHEAFQARTGINLVEAYQPNKTTVGSPVGDIVDSYFVCRYGLSQSTLYLGERNIGVRAPSE